MIFRTARRVVIFVIGMTVVLFGILASFIPFVPAVLVVPAGLAILATEFAWARRFLRRVKERVQSAMGKREVTEVEGQQAGKDGS